MEASLTNFIRRKKQRIIVYSYPISMCQVRPARCPLAKYELARRACENGSRIRLTPFQHANGLLACGNLHPFYFLINSPLCVQQNVVLNPNDCMFSRMTRVASRYCSLTFRKYWISETAKKKNRWGMGVGGDTVAVSSWGWRCVRYIEFLSPSPQWGTADAKIKDPFVENAELDLVLPLKPGLSHQLPGIYSLNRFLLSGPIHLHFLFKTFLSVSYFSCG